MPIYKPTELLLFLEGLGIRPRRSLSQNFLIDGNIIKKIISTANLTAGEQVIEIGPGPGCLTEELLKTGARVLAIEKDRILAENLQRLQTPDRRLEVCCQDVMEFPFEQTLQKKKAKVIANLPYHLTTPIISRLATMPQQITTMVLMVQEEVARRFVAQPKTADYGSFTLFLNFYCYPSYAFKVSRTCFYPEPRVDSAVVTLELKQPPRVDEHTFFRMTRTAFEQRRKMLRSSLRSLYPAQAVTNALGAIGLRSETRPEELSLEDFIKFYRALTCNKTQD